MSITIGSATSGPIETINQKLRMLIWGAPGCGKTVMAYTAPLPIFSLQWDTGGSSSLYKTTGVEILDLSGEGPEITEKFKDINSKTFKEIQEHVQDTKCETIILDSCTTYANKAMKHGVAVGPKFAKGQEQVTAENPGFTGYNIKNMLVNNMIMGMLAIAVRANAHLIVIAHEDLPDKDTKGNVVLQTIMLGSSLAFQVPVDFGEVWHISDSAGQRYISIRPKGLLKPMKTRMFDNRSSLGFVWNYDQIKKTGTTITSLYDEWKSNGFNKIATPK